MTTSHSSSSSSALSSLLLSPSHPYHHPLDHLSPFSFPSLPSAPLQSFFFSPIASRRPSAFPSLSSWHKSIQQFIHISDSFYGKEAIAISVPSQSSSPSPSPSPNDSNDNILKKRKSPSPPSSPSLSSSSSSPLLPSSSSSSPAKKIKNNEHVDEEIKYPEKDKENENETDAHRHVSTLFPLSSSSSSCSSSSPSSLDRFHRFSSLSSSLPSHSLYSLIHRTKSLPISLEFISQFISLHIQSVQYQQQQNHQSLSTSLSHSSPPSPCPLSISLLVIRLVNLLSDVNQKSYFASSLMELSSITRFPPSSVLFRHQLTHDKMPSSPFMKLNIIRILKWVQQFYIKPQCEIFNSYVNHIVEMAVQLKRTITQLEWRDTVGKEKEKEKEKERETGKDHVDDNQMPVITVEDDGDHIASPSSPHTKLTKQQRKHQKCIKLSISIFSTHLMEIVSANSSSLLDDIIPIVLSRDMLLSSFPPRCHEKDDDLIPSTDLIIWDFDHWSPLLILIQKQYLYFLPALCKYFILRILHVTEMKCVKDLHHSSSTSSYEIPIIISRLSFLLSLLLSLPSFPSSDISLLLTFLKIHFKEFFPSLPAVPYIFFVYSHISRIIEKETQNREERINGHSITRKGKKRELETEGKEGQGGGEGNENNMNDGNEDDVSPPSPFVDSNGNEPENVSFDAEEFISSLSKEIETKKRKPNRNQTPNNNNNNDNDNDYSNDGNAMMNMKMNIEANDIDINDGNKKNTVDTDGKREEESPSPSPSPVRLCSQKEWRDFCIRASPLMHFPSSLSSSSSSSSSFRLPSVPFGLIDDSSIMSQFSPSDPLSHHLCEYSEGKTFPEGDIATGEGEKRKREEGERRMHKQWQMVHNYKANHPYQTVSSSAPPIQDLHPNKKNKNDNSRPMHSAPVTSSSSSSPSTYRDHDGDVDTDMRLNDPEHHHSKLSSPSPTTSSSPSSSWVKLKSFKTKLMKL